MSTTPPEARTDRASEIMGMFITYLAEPDADRSFVTWQAIWSELEAIVAECERMLTERNAAAALIADIEASIHAWRHPERSGAPAPPPERSEEPS